MVTLNLQIMENGAKDRMNRRTQKLKSQGSRKVLHSMDKVLNSPSGTRGLMDSDDSDSGAKRNQTHKPTQKKKKKNKAEKMKKIQEKLKIVGTKAIETVGSKAVETGNKLKVWSLVIQ